MNLINDGLRCARNVISKLNANPEGNPHPSFVVRYSSFS